MAYGGPSGQVPSKLDDFAESTMKNDIPKTSSLDGPRSAFRKISSLIPHPSSLLSLLVALLASALILRLAGYDPIASWRVMVEGAVGGRYQIADTLTKATPLILCGLGVAIAFRGGLFNIGAEGQLLAGALATAWLGGAVAWGPAGIPLVLGAAFVGGGLWGLFPALLRTERDVNEVISTLMLNFVAFWTVSWLVHGPLQEASKGYPQTRRSPRGLNLPRIWMPTRLHAGIVVAVVASLVAAAWLRYTVTGLRLRVAGGSPRTARTAGVDFRRMTWLTLFLSGGCAGLAGGVEVLGVSRRLYEQFSPGYGFMAIAVALLARLNPPFVVPAAIFFGALETGVGALQRAAGVSAGFAGVIEASVILTVVAGNAFLRHGISRA